MNKTNAKGISLGTVFLAVVFLAVSAMVTNLYAL